MSTKENTLSKELDSGEIGVEGFPFSEESDLDLALILEDQKQQAIGSVDDVTRALLNEGEPLTDEKVRRLSEVGDALTALSRTLSTRVPDEYRAETREEYEEMYGEDE